jgi:hypothetical protein
VSRYRTAALGLLSAAVLGAALGHCRGLRSGMAIGYAYGDRDGRRKGDAHARLDAVLATPTLDDHFSEALLPGDLCEPVSPEMAKLLGAVQELEREDGMEVPF